MFCLQTLVLHGALAFRTGRWHQVKTIWGESCTQVNREADPGVEECQMESNRQRNGLSETYMDSMWPCFLQALICAVLKQVRWLSASFLDIFVSAAGGSKKPAGRLHRSFLCWSSDAMRSFLLFLIRSGNGYTAISWNYVSHIDSSFPLVFFIKNKWVLRWRINTLEAIVLSFWLTGLFLNVFQVFPLLAMLI